MATMKRKTATLFFVFMCGCQSWKSSPLVTTQLLDNNVLSHSLRLIPKWVQSKIALDFCCCYCNRLTYTIAYKNTLNTVNYLVVAIFFPLLFFLRLMLSFVSLPLHFIRRGIHLYIEYVVFRMQWLYAMAYSDFEPALNALNDVYLYSKLFGEFQSKNHQTHRGTEYKIDCFENCL